MQAPKISLFSKRPWWDKKRHRERRPFLLQRNRLKEAVRAFFGEQNFIEIEACPLQISPGNEVHLHPFQTELVTAGGEAYPYYLHTSPEFACKKLLAAGEPLIFTFAFSFRNREKSPLHTPVFTMLEWYRAWAPYTALMDDCHLLLSRICSVTQNPHITFSGKSCTLTQTPERLTVTEAFRRYTGIDLMTTLPDGKPDRAAFLEEMHRTQTDISVTAIHTYSWSDLFSCVMTSAIEPHLGIGHPTILMEYPCVEAALARIKPTDCRVAERFELYVCGVELANGFGELTDPNEQRRRFMVDMDVKERLYGTRVPLDEDFLEALEHMPPSSGIALGFDRLILLATQAQKLEEVLWTPLFEKADNS
jgi:lysyl-tRNA synthetase class 2